MHDSESDTFQYKTTREQLCEILGQIGVSAESEQFDTDEVEKSDYYYSRYYSHTHRMVTNHGCVKVKDTNIDVIQIIQKG